MQFFYSLPYPNIIGKIIIEPVNRAISFYIAYEDVKLNIFVRGLGNYLNSLGKYTEIFQTDALHTDNIHCCEPNPLEPSHLHFAFKENITAENLHQLFDEIQDFQSETKNIQSALSNIGIEMQQHPTNTLQRLAHWFSRNEEIVYLSPTDARKIEYAYKLGLSERKINYLITLTYSTLIAAIPRAVERTIHLIGSKFHIPKQFETCAKYAAHFILLFYALNPLPLSTKILFGMLSIRIDFFNNQNLNLAFNAFLTTTTFFLTTYSSDIYRNIYTLASSFIVGKMGLWATDAIFNLFDKDTDNQSPESTLHLHAS